MQTSQESVVPLLLSAKEAARLLRVSGRTLWNLTFDPPADLPHVRVGRRVLYSIDDLRRFIDRRRVVAPTEGQGDENAQ